MMRARLLALAAALGAVLVAAGCGVKGSMVPNVAPETNVFVDGPVDTVNHVVHLRWFGSDPDGEVERYEYRFVYPAGQEPSGHDSSAWLSTPQTDSTFVIYTASGYSMPTFVIRAIDDQGLADPTPARQTFQFKNDPPTIVLVGNPVLPNTTLPVATIQWAANDPDGDIGLAHYLVWLDADEANAVFVAASTSFTLPPSMFSDGAGGYLAGPHTVHIRAVDDGGSASAPASFTWNVIAPVGEVLLVDDQQASPAIDPMYTTAFDTQLGAGNYTRLELELNNPFRSPADLTYSFALFKSVFWYQENYTVRSGPLSMAEPAIRAHLAAGGNMYIDSQTLVGTNGALPGQTFLEEIVGADSVRFNLATQTTNWSISTNQVLHPGPQVPYDSLRSVAISTAVDALILESLDEAAFVARPIVLDSSQVEDWVVGVDRVPAGGTGRLVFLSFPLRFLALAPLNAPPPPAPDPNYGVTTLRKILARFGHGTSP